MTIKLAVVGQNVQYSQSPFIHKTFAKMAGLDIEYNIVDIEQEALRDKIRWLQAFGYHGCNITLPFKEEAFALADEKSASAQEVGAVNTFLFQQDRIIADNTDGKGLIKDITQNIGFTLKNKRVLICGAGGAARGILGPLLLEHPATVIIVNRSLSKAMDLVRFFQEQVQACAYSELKQQEFDIVIDATSLRSELLPLPETLRVIENALIYDLKYDLYQKTPLLRWGKAKGTKMIYDGIGMLVEQAALSFSLWTDYLPATAAVIRQLQAKQRQA